MGMQFPTVATHPSLDAGERKLRELGRDIPAQVRIVDAHHEPVTGLQEAKVCGRWCLDEETDMCIISVADMIFLHWFH